MSKEKKATPKVTPKPKPTIVPYSEPKKRGDSIPGKTKRG